MNENLDLATLREFAQSNTPAYGALKRAIESELRKLDSIRNIDPLARNLGLQAAARRYAFDALKDFFDTLLSLERLVKEAQKETYR